ncbi:MAG: hypothetical protein NZT92_16670, partial [Abditibacteriales bacterium]|nr:hypothetical protein [Abditibacteriales bacterium]MDW8367516.1 DUF6785 family protein [Abditibacteriales bacterium]
RTVNPQIDRISSNNQSSVAVGATKRAVVIGVLLSAAVAVWIHYAELILGGRRGHTALANTSIPVGAFFALLLLICVNLAVRRWLPQRALRQQELLVVYVMMASATVVGSSGGIHFLVPSLASAFYFATPENRWFQFQPFIPRWLAPRDRTALKDFFVGDASVPVDVWLVPVLVWSGFLFIVLLATLALCSLMRRQWVDNERLTFPTVVLPTALTEDGAPLLRDRALWMGAAIPLLIGLLNTAHENFPVVPGIQVRQTDLSPYFTSPPWNAMGYTPMSFYPFVIGIAFLLSAEVTFSCWFFYLFTKFEQVMSAVWGLKGLPGARPISTPPFLDHQGAGAFIGIVVLTLYFGRRHVANVIRAAWHGAPADEREALAPRTAVLLLGGCFLALYAFCRVAGMSAWTPLVLLGLVFIYMTAATRVRAEAGNAWLFGPRVDPNTLVVSTFGSSVLPLPDLTIMCYLQFLTTFDLRCLSMPHQLDGMKMAAQVRLRPRALVLPILIATAVVLGVSFWSGLKIWYAYGALSKADAWRTTMGKAPFENLASLLSNPLRPDLPGTMAVLAGLLVTLGIAFARSRWLWWPLHPVGYAVANTPTMQAIWVPFLLGWAAKTAVLRYGGLRVYRRCLPFFLGLILGDFINGGFWTLVGCFVPEMRVYPINW